MSSHTIITEQTTNFAEGILPDFYTDVSLCDTKVDDANLMLQQ